MTLGNVDGGSLDDYAHLDSEEGTAIDSSNDDNDIGNDGDSDGGDDTANE